MVIATGATYRRLGIPALEDLQGRGVFYGPAASEAPAMAGRKVFVAGGGNSAGQTALHMAKWADRVTVLVARRLAGRHHVRLPHPPDRRHPERGRLLPRAGRRRHRHRRHLQSLVLEDTASGARRSVPADALFVLIGSQPRTQWLGEAVARDQ